VRQRSEDTKLGRLPASAAAEPVGTREPRRPWPGRMVRFLAAQREVTLVVFVVLFGLWLSFASDSFLTLGNIEAVLLGLAVEGIVAVGMTVLIASGGFDLSVGAVLALSGVAAGKLVLHGWSVPAAVVAALLLACLIGALNGVLVAKVGINPLIQTLGAMSVIQGVVLLTAGGFGVTNLPPGFDAIGQTTVLSVQTPILVMIAIALAGDFLLRRSRALRLAYYVGGNEKASRLTGIAVDRVKIGAYVLTALLAGLGGIITAARFGSASVEAGGNIALEVIAAVVIGGASLAGGSGTVLGSLLGVLLLQLILNGLNLLGVATYWQPVATGAVLIFAVGFDALTGRIDTGRLRAVMRVRGRASSEARQSRGGTL
jgi:ribose transport system permease protein